MSRYRGAFQVLRQVRSKEAWAVRHAESWSLSASAWILGPQRWNDDVQLHATFQMQASEMAETLLSTLPLMLSAWPRLALEPVAHAASLTLGAVMRLYSAAVRLRGVTGPVELG